MIRTLVNQGELGITQCRPRFLSQNAENIADAFINNLEPANLSTF